MLSAEFHFQQQVPSVGAALLRNGWSTVTALALSTGPCLIAPQDTGPFVWIEVINSKGRLTNGYIIVEERALLAAAGQLLAAREHVPPHTLEAAPALLACLENLVARGLIVDPAGDHYREAQEALAQAYGQTDGDLDADKLSAGDLPSSRPAVPDPSMVGGEPC